MNPTIILSNCDTLKEIEEYLGNAAVERLLEGNALHHHMTWGSFRVSDPSIK